MHRNGGRQKKTHNHERTYRRIRFLRPEQHSDRRPAESRRAARLHGLSLPGHTCRNIRPLSDRPMARNDPRSVAPVGSGISTKDEFSAREGLSANADSPSRLSETIFHRAQGLGNPFRYHNSTEYFPPFENGRFYRTQRDSDRIPAALFIPCCHACDRFQIEAAPKSQKAEYMGKYRRFGSSHSAARSCKDNPGPAALFHGNMPLLDRNSAVLLLRLA